MSKIENKIKKNITKTKSVDIKENPIKNQILNFTKIICGILISVIAVCIIANIANGNYNLEEEQKETDYTNIVAGQTFTRSDDEYYVVFYDDEKILDTINNVSFETIYKVDLNSSLNKNIVSEKGNPKAEDAESLKINGTTIIKIEDGKNVSYVEGYDKVISYLNEL